MLFSLSSISYSNITEDYITTGTLISGSLMSKSNQPKGEGMLADWKYINQNTYNQPISFSLDVKATNVKNYASLWLRFDDENGKQVGSVHYSVKITGTRNFTTYPLKTYIPRNAKKVVFGIFLSGSGRVDVKHYILNK